MKLHLINTKTAIINKICKFFPGIFICLLLTGCQTIDVRGQYISDELIEQINKSNLTKEQIASEVGSPTYIPQYSQDTWYYIQRSHTSRAWFRPKVVDQRIVQLTFNNKGIVQNAQLVDNAPEQNVKIQGQYTETKGTEKSGLQKFVGNIGRFSQANKKKGKGKK